MKWPNEIPKNLWMLLNQKDEIIGYAFGNDGISAVSRYPHIRRAVRFDRATSDAQEHDYIASKALTQLDLFS